MTWLVAGGSVVVSMAGSVDAHRLSGRAAAPAGVAGRSRWFWVFLFFFVFFCFFFVYFFFCRAAPKGTRSLDARPRRMSPSVARAPAGWGLSQAAQARGLGRSFRLTDGFLVRVLARFPG